MSDDEDADPSYDPFVDVNDNKRKYESDSTGSEGDVGLEPEFSGRADKDNHIEGIK